MSPSGNVAVALNPALTHNQRVGGVELATDLGLAKDCRASVTLPFPLYDFLKI
jgi:hypothetical protein